MALCSKGGNLFVVFCKFQRRVLIISLSSFINAVWLTVQPHLQVKRNFYEMRYIGWGEVRDERQKKRCMETSVAKEEKKRGGSEEENRMELKRWLENICRCKNLWCGLGYDELHRYQPQTRNSDRLTACDQSFAQDLHPRETSITTWLRGLGNGEVTPTESSLFSALVSLFDFVCHCGTRRHEKKKKKN